MPDIETYASFKKSWRLAALTEAVEKLAADFSSLKVRVAGGLPSSNTFGDLAPSTRHGSVAVWETLPSAALGDLLAAVSALSTEIIVDVGPFRFDASRSIELARGKLSLIASRSFVAGANPYEVDVRAGSSIDDAAAVHAVRWQRNLCAFLSAMTGEGAASGVRLASICDEGGWRSPFECYATAHVDSESLALDFARGWLSAHTSGPMEDLASASRSELVQRVSTAPDQHVGPKVSPAHGSYDGSLERLHVQRILAMPDTEVFLAFQAICATETKLRAALDIGGNLLDALEDSQTPVTMRLSPKRVLSTPQLLLLPNGLWALHTSPLERLWPLYREVALLLLGD